MAKKTKNQKRKAKVKAKNKQHFHFQTIKSLFRIDSNGMKIKIPNKQERINYIEALVSDFDRKLV